MARLRVFISSTMDDLRNERGEVATKMKAYNFEPVLAESFLPNGEQSWDRITTELETCHLVVLIVGDRYGWVPEEGPGAQEQLSITEMEFNLAVKLELPVLAFIKERPAAVDPEEARRRQEFVDRLSDWQGGVFRSSFDLATDLAETVGMAVVGLLTDSMTAQRADVTRRPRAAVRRDTVFSLPAELRASVTERSAVLFAGAGISLEAGMPSGWMLADALLQEIRRRDPVYELPSQGSYLHVLASDLADGWSRSVLVATMSRLLVTGLLGHRGSTDLHSIALALFDYIVTTNLDDLFERAAKELDVHVIDAEFSEPDLKQSRAVIKLHGSLTSPSEAVLTEKDLTTFSSIRSNLRQAVGGLLRSRELVVLGTALRDPSVVALFNEFRTEANGGWFVSPSVDSVQAKRVGRWGLEPIEADARGFLQALAAK